VKTTPDIEISDLRASLNSNVIGSDDPGYDDVRRVFFTGFDRSARGDRARRRYIRRRPRRDPGTGDGG
jgi:hypothetical protein